MCPEDSLDSFAWEFRQGMAARAHALGDTGESAPEHWERPLGTQRRPRRVVAVAPDRARLEPALDRAGEPSRSVEASTMIWRQDCHALGVRQESRSGSGTGSAHPAIEGSGIPGTNPRERPLKAGEFVLGYPDETGGLATDAAARGARSQWNLRRLPQAAPARRGVPPVPEGERAQRRGRGTARGEDDGAMAQRRAPGAMPASRRSGARRRSAAQQRFRLRRRSDRVQDAPRLAHSTRESARRLGRRGRAAPPDDSPGNRLWPRASRRASWRTTASIGA